ncbi:MAG: hypothetical protein AAB654_11155 [Acidobacteriota bacterium]
MIQTCGGLSDSQLVVLIALTSSWAAKEFTVAPARSAFWAAVADALAAERSRRRGGLPGPEPQLDYDGLSDEDVRHLAGVCRAFEDDARKANREGDRQFWTALRVHLVVVGVHRAEALSELNDIFRLPAGGEKV